MARLGALMLSSVLLGLPRVFRIVTSAALRRSRYVERAPSDAALLEFMEALQPAIDEHCHSLASGGPGERAAVVEVHGLVSQSASPGRLSAEAVSVSVAAGDGVQRLVLHGPTGHRAGAARTLVHWLAHDIPQREDAAGGRTRGRAYRLGPYRC